MKNVHFFFFKYRKHSVRLGESPDDKSFKDYAVSKVIKHPQFIEKELINNLAILFLANDVEFSGEWWN